MAIAAANLVYIGQPSAPAAGQLAAGVSSGPLTKELQGVATFTGDGATTTATLNFIDGTQKVFQVPQVIVGLFAAAAPATIGGTANQAVYSASGATGQLRVGQSIVIAGFANAGNNGTFTIAALSSSTIQVTNAGSVAETNYQATAAFTGGAVLPIVYATRSGVSAANVADTAANTITASVSTVTATGCLVTFAPAPANGATASVAVRLVSVV